MFSQLHGIVCARGKLLAIGSEFPRRDPEVSFDGSYMVTVRRAKRASYFSHELSFSPLCRFRLAHQGQTIVEFTIAIILFLVVAWIPADFGLAFYTSQIAQNAAREGARIAAADSTLAAGNSSCNMPACYTFGNIFSETAVRLPAALLTAASITVQYPAPGSAGTCNQRVLVRVQGQYNFFFYRVLGLLGASVPSAVTVDRKAEMRWEHQSGCVGGAIP